MILYPNRMHVVTVEGRGINKMADLKGKRVSTGSPGSATEVMAFRVIEAAGLDKDKDMKRERLGVAESVNAIKDSKIDAFFWVGGLPTAAVTDLANTPGTKIKMIDHADAVAAMNKKYGHALRRGHDPEGDLPGHGRRQQAGDGVEHPGHAREHGRPDRLQHRQDDLRQARPTWSPCTRKRENFKLENQKAAASPIPFHPGALKYFAEKGIKVN